MQEAHMQEEYEAHIRRLTPSQKQFVDILRNWMQHPTNSLVLISGGPGSGKTFTVIETLKFIPLNIVRMAFTARIAQRIGGRTIHSTLRVPWGKNTTYRALVDKLKTSDDIEFCLSKSRVLMDVFQFDEKVNIVVLDEVGMIAFWLVYWIVQFFYKHCNPVLIVLMGDRNQLKPVQSPYNVFNAQLDWKYTFIEMTESRRFTAQYQQVVDTLKQYMDQNDTLGLLNYVRATFPVVEDIDETLLLQCHRALAYRNFRVDKYNNFYIKHFPGDRVDRLLLVSRFYDVDPECYMDLKPGCDIAVTANGHDFANGMLLVYDRLDEDADVLECRDPQTGRRVQITRNAYTGMFPVVPGFAGTIHKFQGDTIDEPGIVFNFDGCVDLNLIYTALSRVRSMDQILAVVL